MRRIVLLLVSTAVALGLAGGVGLLNAVKPAEATFPGTNGRIAYHGFDGNDYEIYTVNASGGDTFQVTNNNTNDQNPDYSPNGQRIALPNRQRIAYVGYDGNDLEIRTVNVNGGGKSKVTNNSTDDYDPSYSPNGKRIAYVSDEQNITEIYTISVSGEGKFQVTKNDTYDFSPSYSPDGKRIAYVGGDGDGNDYEIFKISPTGGTPVNLTANNTNDFHPSWGSRP